MRRAKRTSEVYIFPREVACISRFLPPGYHWPRGEKSRNLLLTNKNVLVEASFRGREATLRKAFKSPPLTASVAQSVIC